RARPAAGLRARQVPGDRVRRTHRVLRASDVREGAALPRRGRAPLLPAGQLVLRRSGDPRRAGHPPLLPLPQRRALRLRARGHRLPLLLLAGGDPPRLPARPGGRGEPALGVRGHRARGRRPVRDRGRRGRHRRSEALAARDRDGGDGDRAAVYADATEAVLRVDRRAPDPVPAGVAPLAEDRDRLRRGRARRGVLVGEHGLHADGPLPRVRPAGIRARRARPGRAERLGALRPVRRAALAGCALALAAACGGAAAAGRASVRDAGGGTAVFSALPGHRIAGFSLDRDWLALAEDPVSRDACPVVVLVRVPSGSPRRELTRRGGATCRLGGRFWVRPGARAIGNAITKGLWVVRHGSTAIAVKASPAEPEVVLARVTGITLARGPFLGPVVATNWLRLFGDYRRQPDGTLEGGVISGNRRELWTATGPVMPLGLDDEEHAVAVGADGSIAMWHAHGARYGRVPDAHARAAALDRGEVLVLRDDAPRLDVRALSGRLVRSWPIARGAAPLLD